MDRKDVMVQLPIINCVQIFAHHTILLPLIKIFMRIIPNLDLNLAVNFFPNCIGFPVRRMFFQPLRKFLSMFKELLVHSVQQLRFNGTVV